MTATGRERASTGATGRATGIAGGLLAAVG